jgi:hypothetical protein
MRFSGINGNVIPVTCFYVLKSGADSGSFRAPGVAKIDCATTLVDRMSRILYNKVKYV